MKHSLPVLSAAVPAVLLAIGQAFAQETATPPPPAEGQGEPISLLMFFTIGIVLAILIGAMIRFLRSRKNREIADRAINPNHPANK
jgi:hypothetical protein